MDMKDTIEISGFKCHLFGNGSETKVAYMLYPEIASLPEELLDKKAREFGVAVVMVCVPADDWNDALTPWPEPGEAKGCPPFAGKGPDFLKTLQDDIIPGTENTLSLPGDVERNLIGVSLAGLFSLWQWLLCDTFHSIACLSGSFWYEGFIEWFEKQTLPVKKGQAYFLLGRDEPHAPTKAYRSVGVNTEAVVSRFEGAGIPTEFEWVPGNHFTDPLGRADKAFAALYGQKS